VPAVICFLIFFGQIDRKWRLEPKAAYFQGSAPTFFNKILTAHFCSGQDRPAPRSSPPPLFDLVRKVPEITVQDRLCWHDFETYSMGGRIIVKPWKIWNLKHLKLSDAIIEKWRFDISHMCSHIKELGFKHQTVVVRPCVLNQRKLGEKRGKTRGTRKTIGVNKKVGRR